MLLPTQNIPCTVSAWAVRLKNAVLINIFLRECSNSPTSTWLIFFMMNAKFSVLLFHQSWAVVHASQELHIYII